SVVRLLILGIAGITVLVAAGLVLIGPFVMSHVFGQHFSYGRFGLAAVGIGMGLHLTAGTLNQPRLARGQARSSSAAWRCCAARGSPISRPNHVRCCAVAESVNGRPSLVRVPAGQ